MRTARPRIAATDRTQALAVKKVAADVRRLSHRFFFREHLSLVTSAATGSGIFQRAANVKAQAQPPERDMASNDYVRGS
jgi:hypothetical protein